MKSLLASLAMLIGFAVNAVEFTTNVWTGAAGDYKFSTPGNWEGNKVPVSGDGVTLRLMLPETSVNYTLNNDIVGLRIRGIDVNTPSLNKSYYLDGNAMTWVGTGLARKENGDYSSNISLADSSRSGTGNFYLRCPITIVGDYCYYTEGNRTHMYSNVSGDSEAHWASYGQTINYYGDWSNFNGYREVASRSDMFDAKPMASTTKPWNMNFISSGAQIRFNQNNAVFHSDIVLNNYSGNGVGGTGGGKIAFDNHGTWDGDFTVTTDRNEMKIIYITTADSKAFTWSGSVNGNLKAYLYSGKNSEFKLLGEEAQVSEAWLWTADELSRIVIGCSFAKTPNVFVMGAGVVRMFKANNFGENTSLLFGDTSHTSGKVDLQGYDQTIKSLGRGLNNTAAIENYQVTSEKGGVLWTKANTTLSALVTGNASIGADGNVLTIPSGTHTTAGAFYAKNGGLLKFNGGNLTMAASINLSSSGKIEIPAGTTLTVKNLIIDGSTLKPGEYSNAKLATYITGEGSIVTTTGGPVVEGVTAVWQGGSAQNVTSVGTNWDGNVTPDLESGSTRLNFSSGSPIAVVDDEIDAYALTFNRENAFTLSAAGDNSRINLHEGGITANNANNYAIDVPMTLIWGPQKWIAENGAILNINQPISSGQIGGVELAGAGTIALNADNTDMATPFIITNAYSVRVYSQKALGPATREVIFRGMKDANQDGTSYLRFEVSATNDAPIRLANATGPWTNNGLYLKQNGKITCDRTSDRNTVAMAANNDSTIELAGGVDWSNVYRLFFNCYNNSKFIISGPVNGWSTYEACELNLQPIGTQRTNPKWEFRSTGNSWRKLRIMYGEIICGAENTLAPDGWVLFQRFDYCQAGGTGTSLMVNLNGYNQSSGGVITDWSFTQGGATYDPNRHAVIYSAEDATLTMTPEIVLAVSTGAYSNRGAIKFTGKAGFTYADINSVMSNGYFLRQQVSDSTGTLTVSAGKLTLEEGAGWGGKKSEVKVVQNGTLSIANSAAQTAFGGRYSRVRLSLSDNGKLILPSNLEVTVDSLIVDGNVMEARDYTAADLSGHAEGTGTLHVRHSAWPYGMSLIIR